MSNAVWRDDLGDGLVQLRFSDDEGKVKDINAAEMAEALQGLVAFTSDMAKHGLFGDGMPPELRVRPPKEGSFVIETMLQWAAENPEGAFGMTVTSGGLLGQAIRVGFSRLRGDKVADFDYLDNGNVKIKWQQGAVQEISQAAWNRLQDMKRPTRQALRNLTAPLSDDVDTLEIREGTPENSTDEVLESTPVFTASRDDFRAANTAVDEIDEYTDTFDTEAMLKGIDFRPGEKWFIQTPLGSRRASMDDPNFEARLEAGLSLNKHDIFDVTIHESRTVKNGRTTREWSLVKVVRKQQGGGDDHDEPSHSEANGQEDV